MFVFAVILRLESLALCDKWLQKCVIKGGRDRLLAAGWDRGQLTIGLTLQG